MQKMMPAEVIDLTPKQMVALAEEAGCTIQDVQKHLDEEKRRGEWFRNNLYTVIRSPCGKPTENGVAIHLSIKRNDQKPIRDWRHFQQIKNELCGEDCEAVELYPAEDRVVDTANQYHLWVMPPGVKLQIGFPKGRKNTTDPGEGGGSTSDNDKPWKQRI